MREYSYNPDRVRLIDGIEILWHNFKIFLKQNIFLKKRNKK